MKLISSGDRIKSIRSSRQYKDWRKKVFEKNGKKCLFCGSKEKLEVDHIKPLALYPNEALEIKNGRVLCKKCHKKTDTWGVFSSYKDKSNIHPVLRGDLFFKLQSLPQMIEIKDKEIGFSLKYVPSLKKWRAGYKFANINLTKYGDTFEDAIDEIFIRLKYSK